MTTTHRALATALMTTNCSTPAIAQSSNASRVLSDAEITKIIAERVDTHRQSVGIVVGVIEPTGRRVVAYGKAAKSDNSPAVDGDTVFEIGSMSKVFTSLLLAAAVQRGEVALADPISEYLPPSVKVPERGRAITLPDLANHTRGPRARINRAIDRAFRLGRDPPIKCLMRDAAELPAHYTVGGMTRVLEGLSLVAAGALLVVNIAQVFTGGLPLYWWSPLVVLGAALLADVVSGLVHWTADTWFSETMPLLGRRFLRPFRVHHVNPADFLKRDAIDCNGDVAMLNIPFLAVALSLPDTPIGATVALALLAFAAVSLPTNQVHQWAHMPSPPRAVRWLQRRGLILSIEAHARHHQAPYVANYCIATGWCNRWLTMIGFFPACERLVTRITGLEPRVDEHSFVERWS